MYWTQQNLQWIWYDAAKNIFFLFYALIYFNVINNIISSPLLKEDGLSVEPLTERRWKNSGKKDEM